MTVRIVREFSAKDGIGVFLLPEKELDAFTGERRHTYCSIEELYDDNTEKIGFNTEKFILFDRHILDYTDDFKMHEALWKKEHRYYPDYEPVRKNIALLRNTLYLQMFPDGHYDPYAQATAIKRDYLEEMAKVLGATLKRESFFRKISSFSPSADVAEQRFGDFGLEHVGAAVMYKQLLRAQSKFTFNPLRWLKGKFTAYDWNLPDIENTPLRKRDIEEALYQESRKESIGMEHPSARLAAEALITQRVAVELIDPGALRAGDAERSVELAHQIIENLRRMKFDNTNEGLPGVDQQAHDLERGELLAELAMAYQNVMADLAARNPGALGDPVFEAARLAFGKLGHLTLVDAQRANIIEEIGNALPALNLTQHELPKEFQHTYPGEERQLLENIEKALTAAVHYRGPQRSAQVEAGAIRQDFDLLHEKITAMSAHIGATSENLVGEAKAINRMSRAISNRHQDAVSAAPGQTTRVY